MDTFLIIRFQLEPNVDIRTRKHLNTLKNMKVIIQTPGFKADQKLLSFVSEKLQKLDQINDNILEGHVTLKVDKSDTRENKICEIKLSIRGNDLFATRQNHTFEEATSKVVSALKRQLVDIKKEYKGGDVPQLKD